MIRGGALPWPRPPDARAWETESVSPANLNAARMSSILIHIRGEPAWIENCNECNASYATDVYARINGIGTLIVTEQIMELGERFHMQVAKLNCAKGAVPESSSHFVGTYAGIASSPATREAIEASDCLLTVGYRRIESTTVFFTDKLPASAIHLNSSYLDTADKKMVSCLLENFRKPHHRAHATLASRCTNEGSCHIGRCDFLGRVRERRGKLHGRRDRIWPGNSRIALRDR